jgi:hypothetical protein
MKLTLSLLFLETQKMLAIIAGLSHDCQSYQQSVRPSLTGFQFQAFCLHPDKPSDGFIKNCYAGNFICDKMH